MKRLAVLCATLAVLCSLSAAQEKMPIDPRADAQLPRGAVIPSVTCKAQPEQTYALYLPKNYTAERRWPIVYAFDPAARGRIPVDLMKDAAEHYGYIVVTSNNSKNGPWKPTAEAAQAVWEDTHARFAIDAQRVIFAGFSGGARVAARLAQTCKCAQGVFLNGAGFSTDAPPARDVTFGVFATVGLDDFNYGELVNLDATLEKEGFPHFLRRFDGPHRWAPADVAAEALAWMELQAMKEKRRQREDAFVTAELMHAAERAKKLADSGETYFAWENARQVAAAFTGLANTTAWTERATVLEKNPAARAGQKRESADISRQWGIESDIRQMVSTLRDPGANRFEVRKDAEEQIRSLRERTVQEKRPEKHRVLERSRGGVFAVLIETGESLITAKDFALARVYLELAEAARPEWPWPHITLAQCLMLGGDKKDALRALKRARDAGFTAEALAKLPEQMPEFAPLAGDPEFRKMLADPPANPVTP